MAHRISAAVKSNKQLCRLNRAPVAAAELAILTSGLVMTKAPTLTVALGDVMTEGPVTPLGSPLLRPALAQVISEFYRTTYPNLNSAHLKAIMYREMTMIVIGEVTGTDAEMKTAKNRLKGMLRAKVPSEALVLATFKKLWARMEDVAANSQVDLNTIPGLKEALDFGELTTINQRRFTVWNHGGHAFLPSFLPNGNVKEDWINLLKLDTHGRTPVELTATAEDITGVTIDYPAFANAWTSFTLRQYLAFYEATILVNAVELEKDFIHALFACLSHLTKGQNKTEAWITNRFKRVQESMTNVPDLDATILQEFSKMHSNIGISQEQIFSVLAASYKCLQNTAGSSLCWVIEQAVASNITSALVVADIISKMRVFPLEMVTETVVPENQLTSIVRLAMHVIVNRFGTLTGPVVTVKEYADLAFLCLAIHKKSIRGAERASLMAYAGEYTPYLTKNRGDLEAVATSLHELSAGIVAKSVSMEAIIRRYYKDCVGVFTHGGEDELYFDLGPINQVVDEENTPPPQSSVPMNFLPPELKKTGRYYKKQGLETIIQAIQEKEPVKLKNFRSIMSKLSACGMQSSVFFENMLNCHYQLPYMAIDNESKGMFVEWLGEEATTFFNTHTPRTINASTAEAEEMDNLELYPNYYIHKEQVNNPPA